METCPANELYTIMESGLFSYFSRNKHYQGNDYNCYGNNANNYPVLGVDRA